MPFQSSYREFLPILQNSLKKEKISVNKSYETRKRIKKENQSDASFQIVFIPTIIAAGTTNTTILLKIERRYKPTPGIKPRLTIPANIKAMQAIRKGVVSLAVRLNKPTKSPRRTNVVTRTSVETTVLKKPARIAIKRPTKNE